MVLFLRGGGWCLLCVIMQCCPDLRLSGLQSGLIFFLQLFLLRTLELGHTLLACWLSGSLSWAPCIGRLIGQIFGVGGVSFVEMLILYELWAGERLVFRECVFLRYRRPGRPISVSAGPFRPGIDIWRTCWFTGALMRSLCTLPGGVGRFVPCAIGDNHCRLRHNGRRVATGLLLG